LTEDSRTTYDEACWYLVSIKLAKIMKHEIGFRQIRVNIYECRQTEAGMGIYCIIYPQMYMARKCPFSASMCFGANSI